MVVVRDAAVNSEESDFNSKSMRLTTPAKPLMLYTKQILILVLITRRGL